MRARSQRCFLSLVSVQTSQAECALDHDWSPPEPIWASRDRLFSRSTHRVCITCLPAADDRFTAVMTPISLDEFSFFGIVKDCQDFRLHGIVIPRIRFHTVVVAEECVHRVNRYESSISVGMSTSSFFVSVFSVSLRLTGSSATVAVRFSAEDFVVNRFFTEVASCVSVRFSLLVELEAPGVIVVSGGFPCISSSSVLCGFLFLFFMHLWCCRWRSKSVSCRRDVQCRRLWFLWCFATARSFLLTSCTRRVVVRFARIQLFQLF